MSEEHKTKVMYGFYIAIAVILITGFVAGIICGNSLKAPTEEALEAISDLANPSSYAYRYDYEETYEIAQQRVWTGTSTLAMLGVWCISLLPAFLLYIKKLQVEMMDVISWTVRNMGEKLDSLTEKQSETLEIEEQKTDIE